MSDLQQILRNTNPVPAGTPVPDAVRQELFAEVRRTAARQPVRRGRRRWRLPIPMIAVPLLISASVATGAGVYWGVSQATKDQSTALTAAPTVLPSDAGSAAFGEELQAAGEEFMRQTPYPPGVTDTFDWSTMGGVDDGSSPGYIRGTVLMLVQARAVCFWVNHYFSARQAGQGADAADAITILRQAVNWSSIRTLQGSLRANLENAADAASRGDDRPMRRLSFSLDCKKVR